MSVQSNPDFHSFKFNQPTDLLVTHLHFIEQQAKQLVTSKSLGRFVGRCDPVMRVDWIRDFLAFT
jgi:hypothetical protein